MGEYRHEKGFTAMGICIDLYHYNAVSLVAAIQTWSNGGDTQRICTILDTCGSFHGDTYTLLNNEYDDNSNPCYCLFNLLDKKFGLEDSYTVFWDTSVQRTDGKASVDYDTIIARLEERE